jgi:hypothetical protein
MEDIAKTLILSGIAAGFIAQFIGMFLVLSSSVIKGILTFIIPGYIFLALKENGHYYKVIGIWLAGVIAMIVGMLLVP